MFRFNKDIMIKNSTRDLDECVSYLASSGEVPDAAQRIAQVANTIRHFSVECAEGRMTIKQVHDRYQGLKNKIYLTRGLRNCRDPDFSAAYIVMCCFSIALLLTASPRKPAR